MSKPDPKRPTVPRTEWGAPLSWIDTGGGKLHPQACLYGVRPGDHCPGCARNGFAHPAAPRGEHETHLADALADIVELDRAADAADRAISPGSLAMLEAGIESAKTEPTVYLGSFARGAGDREPTREEWQNVHAPSILRGARAGLADVVRAVARLTDPACAGAILGGAMQVAIVEYDRAEAASQGVDLRPRVAP